MTLLLGTFTLAGCAMVDKPVTRVEPDIRVSGGVSPGIIRGERAAQVLAAVEARVLQAFPGASWLAAKSAQADVLLDIEVYSAQASSTRSSQELRSCRRWSEPDSGAKGRLQRLISRNCLDWQVQQIPCLARKYELDVRVRVRQRSGERIVSSDRKVVTSTDRECGDEAPSIAILQSRAEAEVAVWAADLLKSPLVNVATSRPATLTATDPAPVSSTVVAASAQQMVASTTSLSTAARPLEAHALVIGNASYPGPARLANPINDAQAISHKLSELGFQVTRVDDGDRETLVGALSRFQQQAAASQVTVFYYSGHGMQIDGVNYLIPVNIDISKPATLKLQALQLDTIIDTYLPGRARIIFLDACRDNPSGHSSVRGFSRGLAPMQAPAGTLIAYATRDGGVAEDGTGKNSPFTKALLDLIAEPEDISLVLRKVRDRVMRETAGRQQPWEYGSLIGGALVLSRLSNQ